MPLRLLAAATALVAALAAPARAPAAELLMVEEDGCVWCARFRREIGPAYPNTEEGRRAPLREIDIHAPPPEDIAFARPFAFTPTFILVEDGAELGRIEGYPGEEFFWPMLGRLLERLPEAPEAPAAAPKAAEGAGAQGAAGQDGLDAEARRRDG